MYIVGVPPKAQALRHLPKKLRLLLSLHTKLSGQLHPIANALKMKIKKRQFFVIVII